MVDGGITFVSDNDNTTYHNLPATENVIDMTTSKYGNLYVNNGIDIKVFIDGKYKDIQLLVNKGVTFTTFDVEDDEYIIGINKNGVLHQYALRACR